MDGDDNIPRNPDGLYVEAKSVSVYVNVHVGVIVVVRVTVIVILFYKNSSIKLPKIQKKTSANTHVVL